MTHSFIHSFLTSCIHSFIKIEPYEAQDVLELVIQPKMTLNV